MLIVKCTNASSTYWIVWHSSLTGNNYLVLNEAWGQSSNGEQNLGNNVSLIPPTSTVFTVGDTTNTNANGSTYVAYLFASDAGGFGDDGSESIIKCGSFSVDGSYEADVECGFEPQLVLIKPAADSASWLLFDTMRGAPVGGDAAWLAPNLSQQEAFAANRFNPTATGFHIGNYAYSGTNSGTLTNTHNLGVTPELMIGKGRGISTNWYVFHKDYEPNGWLQSTNAFTNSWRIGEPTSSSFVVRGINNTATALNGSSTYIAYLFATLAGVSKVGSYIGTGGNLDVDCGFAAGARFILIKRSDSTGDWYLWDTERGIVAGNDPYLLLNTTAAEVTSTDYIDPLSSGFTVTSSAPAALNASGGTYIFLAIA